MTIAIVGALVLLWLVIGTVVGLIETRRGHWRYEWVVLAVLGPLAVAYALQRHRHPAPGPVVMREGRARRGRVDILVGLDASPEAEAAATVAVRLLGPRLRRVTLATVLDVDTATPHEDSLLNAAPWPEERAARDHLEEAARRLRADAGVEPGLVVLAGVPARALEEHARNEGYEVVVVGCRGRGLSTRLLGSCASMLASATSVPVLLIPSPDPAPNQSAAPVGA